jgi:hypothetical protein
VVSVDRNSCLTGTGSVGGRGSERLVLPILGVDSRDPLGFQNPERMPDGDGTSQVRAGDDSFGSFKGVVGDSACCCCGGGMVKSVSSSLLLSSLMIP